MSTQRTKTDPVLFFSAEDAVAIRIEPQNVFGMLTRAFTPPRDVAAMVTRERGERAVFKPGDEVRGDGVTELTLVRILPISLSLDLRVTSLDHYRCEATVNLRVAPIAESGELAVFDRTLFGSRNALRFEHIEQYLRPSMQQAVEAAAEGRGVGVLIEAGSSDAIATEIAEHLKKATFSAGLKLESPIDVRIDSSVYRQVLQSRAQAKRQAEEFAARDRIRAAAAVAQNRHAERLAKLLANLKTAADESPDVDVPELLRTFADSDRRELYAALVGAHSASAATRFIVVGSGGELLFFDPASIDAPLKRVPMPDRIGAVRSLQVFADCDGALRLLVGASTGLYEVSADGEGKVWTYPADPGAGVRGGVNSAALVGDRVFASHSELGLLSWTRRQTTPADCILADRTRDCSSVRCVQFFDGNLFFSLDDVVCRLSVNHLETAPDEFLGSTAAITAIRPTRDAVYAGNADGKVLLWDNENRTVPQILHAGRQRSVESIEISDTGGLPQLFFTDTSLAVFSQVIGDAFTCRYEAGGQTIRRAEVAADLIVGTNDVRDRIIVWKPGRPESPCSIVPVSPISGHSIQDVCLIPVV